MIGLCVKVTTELAAPEEKVPAELAAPEEKKKKAWLFRVLGYMACFYFNVYLHMNFQQCQSFLITFG